MGRWACCLAGGGGNVAIWPRRRDRNLLRTSFLDVVRTFLSVLRAERLSLSFRIFISRAFVFLLRCSSYYISRELFRDGRHGMAEVMEGMSQALKALSA